MEISNSALSFVTTQLTKVTIRHKIFHFGVSNIYQKLLADIFWEVTIFERKILLVVDEKISFSEGPSSRFLYIARILTEKGFKVKVMGRKGERVDQIEVVQPSGRKSVARLKILFHAYADALIHHYNVLIIQGGLLAFFLLFLKVVGKKIISDFHGWLFYEIKGFYKETLYNKLKAVLYSFLERTAIRYSDAIVSVSEGARNLLGEEKEKSIVLENGIAVKEALGICREAEKKIEKIYKQYLVPRKKPIIGFLGNWERWMDMETMFLGAKMARVDMVIVGEGPHLDEYKEKWGDNITFTSKLDRREALRIMHLCEAVVVPYKMYHTPTHFFSSLKVKDYLGIGKPIIMAKVTGREVYLVPNENVLLYKPGNAEDLANKIKTIISNKKLAEEMRWNNLKLARRFDWQVLVEKSGLIEKLLEP